MSVRKRLLMKKKVHMYSGYLFIEILTPTYFSRGFFFQWILIILYVYIYTDDETEYLHIYIHMIYHLTEHQTYAHFFFPQLAT